MPVNWITYKGKRILYADFHGLTKNEALFATLQETRRELEKAPAQLLILVDLREASINGEFMSHIKANSNGRMQARIDRLALVGINGLKKVLIDGYLRVVGAQFGSKMKVCETEEEAKEYLVG